MAPGMRAQTGQDTETRMILFYGAGSGAGKSTLSRALRAALDTRGIDTCYFAEEDVLRREAFTAYVDAVAGGNADDIDTLFSCCERFIEECDRSQELHVVDSILPCLDWLAAAGCTITQIRPFYSRLNRLLEKLHPLQVFLTGDTEAFLQRAIHDRGEEWALALCRERRDSDDMRSLLPYFNQMREMATQLLDDWPFGRVIVDTETNDVATCVQEILRHLDCAPSTGGLR